MQKRSILIKIAIELCLIYVAVSSGCQYYTQSSCTSVGCKWSNNTCIVGTGACQGGWAFQSSINECVQCSTLGSQNCTSICSQYFYDPTASTCQSCININNNCLTCTAIQCTSCVSRFSVDPAHASECLIDFCQIRFCVSCQSNSVCYLCQTGYNPTSTGTLCSVSVCNIANCLYCLDKSSCVTCQSGYQLSLSGSTCTAICNDPFCESCSSPSVCTSCFSGYNFNSNTGYICTSCSSAQAGCSICESAKKCTVASAGYYLQVDIYNKYTGNVQPCKSSCATCSSYNTCNTCQVNYNKLGTTCYYNKNVQAKFTLNSGVGSKSWFNNNNSDQQNLANSFLQLNQIQSALANISDITDLARIIITSLILGSIVVDAILVGDPLQDFNTFASNIANNANSLPDFTVVSSSLTVNGGTSSSSTNIGLILGITIPLVVLLVVIIIPVKIYMGDSDEKSTQETQKEIQLIQM